MAKSGRLTVKQVENARSERGKDLWLSDGGGLYLHVRPSGTKAWRMRYMIAGTSRVLDLGSAELKSLADARSAARNHREMLDRGLDPLREQARAAEEASAEEVRRNQEIASRRTFAVAVDAWVVYQLAGRKDKGAEALRILKKDVLATLGNCDLTAVTKAELGACLDRIVARGARRLANICLRELKQFFHWCEARGWVARSPLFGVEKKHVGGEEVERDRVLSVDELRQLRDALPAANLERHSELAIWILLSTLARVGELSRAAWADIDLEAGTWFLQETKNSQPHTIYLSDFSIKQFQELKRHTGWSVWVMPSARKRRLDKAQPTPEIDRPMASSALTKQIHDRQSQKNKKHRSNAKEALILSGGSWTPHDLRRTGATLMGENGVTPEIIERCLNHKEQRKVIRIYQRQELIPERRQAWRTLGEILDQIVTGAPRKVIHMAQQSHAVKSR